MLSLKQICCDVAAASSCEVSMLRRAWESKGVGIENEPQVNSPALSLNITPPNLG